jgi:hypothetical protein
MADRFYSDSDIANRIKGTQFKNVNDKIRAAYKKASIMNPDRVDGFNINDALTEIAPMQIKGMGEFLHFTGVSKVYMSEKSDFKSGSVTSNPAAMQTLYEKLHDMDFFHNMRAIAEPKKYSTPEALMQSVVQLNKTHNIKFGYTKTKTTASIESLYNAATSIKNGIDNGGLLATFDTETLGGNNQYGYKEVDALTEFSMSFRDKNGNEVEKGIRNIVGLSQTQADAYEREIEALRDKPYEQMSTRERVILDRFSMYGHEQTNLDRVNGNDAIWQVKNMVDKDKVEGVNSVDNALNGIKALRKVGEAQDAAAAANGNVYEWKNQIKSIAEVLNTGKLNGRNVYSAGYNSTMFDIPALNLIIDNDLYMSGSHIEPMRSNYVDVYSMVKNITADYGNLHYLNRDIHGFIDDEGKSTQTQITNLFVGKHRDELISQGAVPHIASFDEKLLSMLFTHKGDNNMTAFDEFSSDLSNIFKKNKKLSGVYSGANQQLFMVNQTNPFDSFSMAGGLNFVYDSVSDSYKTFNGYEMGSNDAGKFVREAGFGQYGMQKRGLYSHNIVKINRSEMGKYKNVFATDQATHAMQEYGVDELYMIASTPIYDTKMAKEAGVFTKGLDNTVYSLAFNQDQVEALLNSGIHVGDLINGRTDLRNINNYTFNKEAFENRPDLLIKTIAQGSTGAEIATMDLSQMNSKDALKILFDMGLERSANDSAARLIRDMDYSRFKNVQGAIKYMDEEASKLNGNWDKVISNLVSKNQPLTLSLLNSFGYYDYKTGGQKLYSNTISKVLNAGQYFKSMEPVYQDIANMVDQEFNGDGRDVLARKSVAFKNAVQASLEYFAGGDKIKAANGRSARMFAQDLNYAEFNFQDIFGELPNAKINSSVLDPEGIFKVNLNSGAGLVRSLFEHYYSDLPIANNSSNDMFDKLEKFMHNIGGRKEYRGAFDHINTEEFRGKNASIFADKIVEAMGKRVSQERESNPAFGYANYDKIAQYVLSPHEVVSEIYKEGSKYGFRKDEVRKRQIEAIRNTPKVSLLGFNDSDLDPMAEEIINSIVMPLKKQDYMKHLNFLDPVEKRSLEANYDLARVDAKNFVKDFLKGIANTPLKLGVMNDGTNSLAIMRGNEVLDSVTLPMIRNMGSILYTQIDNNKYVIRPVLDTDAIRKSKTLSPENIKYITTYGKATKNSFSIGRNLERAMKNDRDPYNALLSGLAALKSEHRSISPAIDSFNPQIFQTQLEQDVNGIVQILPELKDVIEDLEKRNIIPLSSVIGHLKDMFKASDADRVKEISKMRSTERNAFVINGLIPVLHELGNRATDSSARHFLTNVTSRVKDTHLTEGDVATGAFTIGAGSAFDNQGRPTLNQFANLVYYDKSNVDAGLKKEGLKNVSADLIVTDPKSQQLLQGMVDESGRTMTSTITSKFATVDTNRFRGLITDAHKDPAFIKAAELLEMDKDGVDQLKEMAMHINMYEQEIFMDSRLHDVVFNKVRLQTISAHKQMEILHDNELTTIENLKRNQWLHLSIEDGKIIYKTGREVNTGDILVTAKGYSGASQPYVAKYNGIFRGGYFNQYGELVSQQDVNESLKGFNGEVSQKNISAVTKFLEQKYDYKMYVLPKEELYGYKIFQSTSEKGVANNLKAGLGTLNPKLRAQLENKGFAEEIGTIHHKWYLDEHLFPQIEKAFGTEAADIKKAILNERHAMSDIVFRGMDVFKDLNAHFIINQNIPGHNNSMVLVKSAIGLINEKGQGSDKIAELFENVVNGKVEFKDGKLHVPSNLDGAKININKLNGLLDELGISKEIDIKSGKDVIGYTGYSEFTHIIDNQGGTSVGVNRTKQHAEELLSKRKELDELKDGLHNLSGKKKLKSQSRINALQDEITELSNKHIGENIIHRGLKYSDRTHLNLGRMRFDDDLVNTLKDRLSTDEFKSLMRGYGEFKDTDFVLNDNVKNTKVLQSYLDYMKDVVVKGDNDIQLKHKHLISDKDKYLLEAFKSPEDMDMSVDFAKKAYSLNAGNLALEYNENGGTGKVTMEALRNHEQYKFNAPVSIGELPIEIKEQAHSITKLQNNPYTNNSIIDLGHEFGPDRYLAVGRQVEKYNGDSLIKAKHIEKLNLLKKRWMDFKDDSSAENKSKVLETRQELIQQQRADLNSKFGLADEMIETRMNESHLGKGAGLIVHQHKDFKMGAVDATQVEKNYNLLKAYNPAILDKAMYGDKSLLQHYAEGKIYDAQFRSVEAFRRMGYFDTDVMKKRLENIHENKIMSQVVGEGYRWNKDNVRANEEATMKLLEKFGDVALTTRFPEIMEGSNKPSLMYLDRTLAANEARALGVAGSSMKLDYDGDTYFAARMKSKSQESYLDYIIKGGKVSEDTAKLVASENIMLNYRAVGHNRYYEQTVQKKLQEEMESAVVDGGFKSMLNKNTIGGYLYSSESPKNYGDAINQAARAASYITEAKEGLADGYKQEDLNNAVVNVINKKHGEGTETARQLIDDYAVHVNLEKLQLERTAKIFKTTIGEANTVNYKLRKVFDLIFS